MVVLVSYTGVRMNLRHLLPLCSCYQVWRVKNWLLTRVLAALSLLVISKKKKKKNGDLISSRCHLKINICCIYQVVGMVRW